MPCLFIKLDVKALSSFVNASHSMLLALVLSMGDQCVCVHIFIKLHMTMHSGPVILPSATSVGPPKGVSNILVTKTSDQTRQRGHTFCPERLPLLSLLPFHSII